MKKCENCRETQYKKLYNLDYKGESFYSEKNFNLSVYRCLRCGLIALDFDSDRENREEIHNFWWEKTWLDTYSSFKEKMNLNYIEKLRFFENKIHGRKILDVGCGCGFFLSVAKKGGWDTVGVDISQPATDYAKNILGLEVLHSTVSETNFPNDYFDLITMWDVLEHLDNPSGVMNELRRILKPKGLLVIETPNVLSLTHLIAHISYKLSFGKFIYFVKKIYIPSHLFYFSKRTLVNMLRRSGFIYDEKKIPFKSLFNDLDIIFSANRSKEKWARNNVFKFLVNLEMKFSEIVNLPYRLITIARKRDDR